MRDLGSVARGMADFLIDVVVFAAYSPLTEQTGVAMEEILAGALAAAEPHRGSGRVADYIPALARVDPHKLGIAFADGEGRVHGAGDCDEPFSIQSISKVFTLALALERVGAGLVGQGRPRAVGQRVQLDRPARTSSRASRATR